MNENEDNGDCARICVVNLIDEADEFFMSETLKVIGNLYRRNREVTTQHLLKLANEPFEEKTIIDAYENIEWNDLAYFPLERQATLEPWDFVEQEPLLYGDYRDQARVLSAQCDHVEDDMEPAN